MERVPISYWSVIILWTILLTGCQEDDPNVDEGNDFSQAPPQLPSVTTMLVDFEDFSPSGVGDLDSKANWEWASQNVRLWNVRIVDDLEIPLAGYQSLRDMVPAYNDSVGLWEWRNEYFFEGTEYSALLTARQSGSNSVFWNMFISLADERVDFQWLSGNSSVQGTSGSWSFRESPDQPIPFLDISWGMRTVDSTISRMQLTDTRPETEISFNGGFMVYETIPGQPLDRFYEIYSQKTGGNTTIIRWSSQTKQGRIIDFKHFEDLDYHCWDVNLDDTEC